MSITDKVNIKTSAENVISTPLEAGGYHLDFAAAAERLKKIVHKTPLQLNHHLSKKYNCKIYLKREDLQVVRSYKLRGAYNAVLFVLVQVIMHKVLLTAVIN